MEYCDIERASYGIYCYNASPKIQNCNFEDNSRALYLYNADNIVIKDCQLTDNSYAIYSYYSDNILIKNNVIDNTYYYGVYLYRSSATVIENTIKNTNYYDGIYVSSYGDIDMNHVYPNFNVQINNTISDNHRNGIYISSTALADLGVFLYLQPPNLRGGFNHFKHGNGTYDAQNASSNILRAEVNWWDNMALSGLFDITPTAINRGYQLPLSKSTNNESLDAVEQLIAEAYKLEMIDSSYNDAIKLLDQAVSIDPSDSINLNILLTMVRLYTKMNDEDGLLDKLDQLYSEYSDNLVGKIALDYSVSRYLGNRDFNEALKRSEKIVSIWASVPGAYESVAWSLFDQGMIYMEMDTNDNLLKLNYEKSGKAFTRILSEFPESEAAWIIRDLLDIDEPFSTLIELPSKYLLRKAYPNPFNPKTTIRFDLPEESRVEIVVYDLMGREVWKSAKTNYPAGTYSVIWNGVNQAGQLVGTGMYIVRLKSPRYSATQKVLLMK